MENPRIAPFVLHHQRYDDWFERHGAAYLSELLAVRGQGSVVGVKASRPRAMANLCWTAFGADFGVAVVIVLPR